MCEHWSQLQAASASSDVTADQYLQRWTQILMYQNNELSELINRLDEETAGRTRKVLWDRKELKVCKSGSVV